MGEVKQGSAGRKRGPFVAVPETMLAAPAYHCLGYAARLVLFDMVWHRDQATGFGARPVGPTGFEYSVGMCRVGLDRSTFYAAVEAVCAKGFFVPVGGGEGFATRFRPGRGWKTYTPDDGERRRLQRVCGVAKLFHGMDAEAWWASALSTETQAENPTGTRRKIRLVPDGKSDRYQAENPTGGGGKSDRYQTEFPAGVYRGSGDGARGCGNAGATDLKDIKILDGDRACTGGERGGDSAGSPRGSRGASGSAGADEGGATQVGDIVERLMRAAGGGE